MKELLVVLPAVVRKINVSQRILLPFFLQHSGEYDFHVGKSVKEAQL